MWVSFVKQILLRIYKSSKQILYMFGVVDFEALSVETSIKHARFSNTATGLLVCHTHRRLQIHVENLHSVTHVLWRPQYSALRIMIRKFVRIDLMSFALSWSRCTRTSISQSFLSLHFCHAAPATSRKIGMALRAFYVRKLILAFLIELAPRLIVLSHLQTRSATRKKQLSALMHPRVRLRQELPDHRIRKQM